MPVANSEPDFFCGGLGLFLLVVAVVVGVFASGLWWTPFLALGILFCCVQACMNVQER